MPSTSSLPSASHSRAPSPRTMRTNDSRVGLANGWRKAGSADGADGRGHDRQHTRARCTPLDAVASAYTRPDGAPSTPRPLVVPAPLAGVAAASGATSLGRLAHQVAGCDRGHRAVRDRVVDRWVVLDRSPRHGDRRRRRRGRAAHSSAGRPRARRAGRLDRQSNAYLQAGQESRRAARAVRRSHRHGRRRAWSRSRMPPPEVDVATLEQRLDRCWPRTSGLVEQARANNRQGFPSGAAYQRQANDRGRPTGRVVAHGRAESRVAG